MRQKQFGALFFVVFRSICYSSTEFIVFDEIELLIVLFLHACVAAEWTEANTSHTAKWHLKMKLEIHKPELPAL